MEPTSTRLRGFIRKPTAQQVKEAGAAEFLHLTDAEAEMYAGVLEGVLSSIDRLDELPFDHAPLKWTTRDPGRRPTPEEDPFNAFVRRCLVPGAPDGPLAGMRFGAKDNLAVAGVPLTNGSRVAPYTPTSDAVAVERLLDAGGTLVGKLNLDDFSSSGTGESAFFAPARNPHDRTRSAGGSSGGSGSAVASGHVDLSLGVDQGGSARIPASFNGVVSLKATHGAIPSAGVTHMDHSIDYVCPIARTVRTTAIATDVLTGHDERDPQWVRGANEPTRCVESLDRGVAGMTIAVVEEAVDPTICDPDVLTNFERALTALEEAGATVTRVSVPLWKDAWSIETALLCTLAWGMNQSNGIGFGHRGVVDENRAHAFALTRKLEADEFAPFYKVWLLTGRYLQDEYHGTLHAKAQNLRYALTKQVEAALGEATLLAMPTTPQVAPELLDHPEPEDVILGRGTTMVTNTAPTNLTGHPSLAVPTGRDRDGMPTSIQLVAGLFQDATTFAAGAVVEEAIGTLTPPGLPLGSAEALDVDVDLELS
ncbi:amidase family protein [Kineococcus sp. G2]|uniref:amidase family protein n=1 Tax=Kineococcus sp. G2 TaxID=3127484 RepID=UPI00301D076D